MIKIIQLDGYAANPGDVDMGGWENIKCPDGTLCDFTVYPRTAAADVVERSKDADALIINKVLLTADIIAQLPKLKYIGVLATGYNVVDIEAAHRRGIVVTNVPAYSTQSVAQLVLAHLLNITNDVAAYSKAVHDGAWSKAPDFTFSLTQQQELSGHVMGIVGYGDIGRAVSRIALALGMHVLLAPSLRPDNARRGSLPDGVMEAESLEHFFRKADVVTLHCPLTTFTRHIINSETLGWMKPTAIVINTGRGPLVDEAALADALNSHTIAAAAIDVMEEEPPAQTSPLLSALNCHITPHIAWATLAARQRLQSIAIENVKAFLRGEKLNRV